MNAPIKFSTQKGEGGTVGYSVMTILFFYSILDAPELPISLDLLDHNPSVDDAAIPPDELKGERTYVCTYCYLDFVPSSRAGFGRSYCMAKTHVSHSLLYSHEYLFK